MNSEYKTANIVANKIDKFNNNLTPPSSPTVKIRSNHLWRDMMGVLRRKDSTSVSNVALANAINNNRVSCPAGPVTYNRSQSVNILRHQRYYHSEVRKALLLLFIIHFFIKKV